MPADTGPGTRRDATPVSAQTHAGDPQSLRVGADGLDEDIPELCEQSDDEEQPEDPGEDTDLDEPGSPYDPRDVAAAAYAFVAEAARTAASTTSLDPQSGTRPAPSPT